MLPQYLAAEGLYLTLKLYAETGALQSEVEPANPRKKRGHFVCQDTAPGLEHNKNESRPYVDHGETSTLYLAKNRLADILLLRIKLTKD